MDSDEPKEGLGLTAIKDVFISSSKSELHTENQKKLSSHSLCKCNLEK